MRYRKVVNPDGKGVKVDLEGVGGGENVIRVHCTRKEVIFNKRGKRENRKRKKF